MQFFPAVLHLLLSTPVYSSNSQPFLSYASSATRAVSPDASLLGQTPRWCLYTPAGCSNSSCSLRIGYSHSETASAITIPTFSSRLSHTSTLLYSLLVQLRGHSSLLGVLSLFITPTSCRMTPHVT